MRTIPLFLPEWCLPTDIFDARTQTIRLPLPLSDAYERLLDRHDLREIALSRTQHDSPAGGIDKPATDRYFAQQFDNSAARSQLAITNATRDIGRVSNALIKLLSGTNVCITDVPFGSGAATFAILSAVAQLRAESILPRLPLEVDLIGGEISEHARTYAAQLLDELRPFLESQSIFVREQFVAWDVTDNLSNTDLIQRMVRASGDGFKRLVIVANFSSFLKQSGKRKQAEPQLGELFRHASTTDCLAIWMEPQMSAAVNDNGLFATVAQWVTSRWHAFMRINSHDGSSTPFATCELQFQSQLTPGRLRPVRLAVMHLDLVRS